MFARHAHRLFALALIATSSAASDLVVSVDHHVVYQKAEPRSLYVVFLDEPLVAAVKLDVYSVPQLPSSARHLDELRAIPRETWAEHLAWDVRDASGTAVPIEARVQKASVADRGPEGPPGKQTTVPVTTFEGRFDLGVVPPGDYEVRVRAGGLTSKPFRFAVRTGQEPEVRDKWLATKASSARDWKTFRQLQIERVELDPHNAGALLALAERSLDWGTLEATNALFDRAVATMLENAARWQKENPRDGPEQAALVAASVGRIRALQRVLPEYFEKRSSWQIATDPETRNYVIRRRGTLEVIREIAPEP